MLECKVMILPSYFCLYLLIDCVTDDDGGNDEGLITYLFFILVLNCISDIRMASPQSSPSHNLQGASRITGGVFRGRAYGNVFNLADSRDLEIDTVASVVGKVHLYDSCVDDPATTKPKSAFKLKITTSLGVVLSKLAEKSSPVRRKFLINLSLSNIFESHFRF